MQPRLFNHQSGYTLIELLLAITLVTILTGFTMSGLLSINKHRELQNEVQELADALKQTQNLALGGVQSGSSFVNEYRLQFTQETGDPDDFYRGYQIERLDDTGTLIEPVLQTQTLACAMCVSSTTDNFTFLVPAGVTTGLPDNPTSLSICYPSIGEQSVSVDQSGRVQIGTVQASSCTCPFGC